MPSIQLLTKVRLPQRRQDVLRRPRLVDFLHQNVDKRLILVCTAPGYGKTTLLVDFAHDVDLPVCWYSLDASDVDPRTFFEYLLLSLRQRFPAFGKQTEALLNSVEDLSREVNSVVASLANEIQSDIPDYFLLVLDDFHWTESSDAVNAALDQLIYYLPDNCHLVLSSRTLPSLTFSRLAAQRQVAGLGTTDLRFTTEELAHLLRDNFKLVMPAAQVEQTIEASEGWITGIILTTHTLWMGLVESLVKAKGAASPLFDYLANEAFLQQPPEVQRFLLCSSVLGTMTPAACDRLFAEGTAGEMLSYLVKANLFLTELEGPDAWYRYHNLFQDFLQAKLKAEDASLFARLHSSAAEMDEAEGHWESAFSHHRTAGNPPGAARLVERVGDEMIRSGRWRTLYQWLDSLPPAVVNDLARLCLFRSRTYIWAGEPERAILQADRAVQRYRLEGNLEEAASALTLKATGLRLKSRFIEALEACGEALAILGDLSSRVAAEIHRVAGICLASLGRLPEASSELQQALSAYQALQDEDGIASTCQTAGIIAVRTGDLGRSLAYYQRALDLWRRFGSADSISGTLNCIASVHHRTGEYQRALPILEEALAGARQAGSLRSEAFALAGLGDVRRDSGNPRGALEPYEAALDIAQRLDEISLVNYLLDALANTHRLLGDYATAERLLRQALLQAEENQTPYEVASYSVSAAVLAEEQDDLNRAEGLLRSAIERLTISAAPRDMARARFHLARTLLAHGDQEGTARELEACLELCRQLGYDQFMVAEGQRAGPLLSWAIPRGIGGRRLELVGERLRLARSPAPIGRQPRIRVESAGPKRIEVYSLGQARVLIDSRLITSSDWAVEKTKELFFYLLEQPHSLRKEQIADALWSELELGKSSSQFHSTLYRLRRALFPQCVAYHDGRYQLALGKVCWHDAEEFLRLLSEHVDGDRPRAERIERYEQALRLYKGPYLEEFYSDWATSRREQIESRYLQTLTRLAKLKAESGALDQASELLQAAVAADPFWEEAHYGLIHYAALGGDRAAALRHYRRYVKLLRDELSAKPSDNVQMLADRISRGQPIP